MGCGEAMLSGEDGDLTTWSEPSLLEAMISRLMREWISVEQAMSRGAFPLLLTWRGLAPCFRRSLTTWKRTRKRGEKVE